MRFIFALAALGLAACGAVEAPGPSAGEIEREAVEAGRLVAEAHCAACHAIDASMASPNPAAPPFSAVGDRYDMAVLREEFAAGVHIGPGVMPTFDLTVEEADALVAYIQSQP